KNMWAMGVLVAVLVVLLMLCITRQNIRQIGQGMIAGTIALLLFVAIGTLLLNNVQAALLYGLRLVAILLPTPLLAITTPPADLVRALQAAKLPSFLILSLMLTWRFLPIIQQEAQRILEANQLRGVDISRQPQHWFAGLFVPLIFRIVSYADDVTIGLETRGYDPDSTRSMSQPLVWRIRDTLFVFGSVLVLVWVGYLDSVGAGR
ncbi:MAG: energy-coupling factor transporter transmembrane protein EcfT, partial [Leptolyngbyaceae cyanobacterium CAN_BIN12]|nr:energy-coupling factor transporter transmembrane protein EcfT [Leptolyngbyaceae cyanobacterium CAN_BIN12]